MASIVDVSANQSIFQVHEDDQIIARPGEPIVKIDSSTARRKASGYIGREISMMMGGIEAALVYSNGSLVWRVPVVFTTPSQGQLGIVGVIDVDAHTGELLLPSNLEETLLINANALLKSSPHSPTS
jgi:hypothetical protein